MSIPIRKKTDTTFQKNIAVSHWLMLDFEIKEERIYLKLINRASHPLHNVQVTFNTPLLALAGTKNIQELPLLKHQTYCAVGKEITIFLDTLDSFFHFQKQVKLQAKITYEYMLNNKKTKVAYVVDHSLEALKGLPQHSSISYRTFNT